MAARRLFVAAYACSGLAGLSDRRRRPIAPAADDANLRRHRVGAIQPVDCRRRRAVHPRVLRRRGERLAPGGIICQCANIYNISDRDLRSIAATFVDVFPAGTVWIVGENDALFIASADPVEQRLHSLARGWTVPAVADDLHTASGQSSRSRCCRCLRGARLN